MKEKNSGKELPLKKEKMRNENIAGFYDKFADSQRDTGVNDRIYLLYKRMLKYGLNKNSNILELGCGIGTTTNLFLKTIKGGAIEAVDISARSIQYAKSKIDRKNVTFFASDITTYKPELKKIDFITLFDVIEHIPIEKHVDLFKNISHYINDHTLLLVNIPNPEYIEYDQLHQPEVLQIIDQPIYLNFILKSIEGTSLKLTHFETYSIWVKNDYNFIVLEKRKEFKEEKIHDERNLYEKLAIKLFRLKLQYFYKYR